jgi:hypothetical protein
VRLALAAALLGLVLAGGAGAADPGIDVGGHAEHALHLTASDLKALPQASADVSFETGHGQQSGHYTGALLWDVVQKAGIADAPGAKAKHHLQHAVLVTGRDGYEVAVAIGEIDPDFENKTVLLVDDGAEQGIRLIVPGDKKGGRAVRDVVRIEIE